MICNINKNKKQIYLFNHHFLKLIIILFLMAILSCGGSSGGGGGSNNNNSEMVIIQDGDNPTFSWDAPTTNEDGSLLTDLAGYTVYCSNTEAGIREETPLYDKNVNAYTVTNFAQNKFYYCAVKAHDYSGNYSDFSNTVTFR